MSYAAFKVVHPPTGVENCVSAYLTHCAGRLETDQDVDVDVRPASSGSGGVSSPASSYWGLSPRLKDAAHVGGSALPNLVLSKANVLEIYHIRVQEGFINQNQNGLPPVLATNGSWASKAAGGRRGGFMAGVLAVWLELVCAYRLHGNVENMAVLSLARHDGRRLRDAIILTFQDAKISVLAFDDSTHNLRICSLHSFEGPEWLHLKRGREKFPRGPFVRADPLGRCAGVLLYDSQLVLMKAAQVGDGLVEDDEGPGPGSTMSARIESSYVVSLRDMDMKHIKDFVFLNGFIEPVVLFLHEKEPTWTGRVGWKRHTNAITALSINTSLKQHPVIWAATDLPYDSYKLLAVPSPIGGVVVVCANSLHYCSQSTLCSLGLNEFAVTPDGSIEMPKSKISVELDGAHAAWISHDVALFSTKAGNLLLLSLVFDGRVVQKLELSKSRASVLASCLCVVRDSFFFLGSRLGDSLLVQYTSGTISAGSPTGTLKDSNEEHDEMDGDSMQHPPKRICGDSSDLSQEGISAEELSLYYSSPSACDSPKRKTFSFAVRDSLVNIGPLRDIAYGPRMHADGPASSVNKQSNYELVACSGHGKNGSLSILHQSIRPDLITEVDLPGCNGVWTVYHQTADNATSEAHENPNADHFHAYLIISLETRTMVLETGDMLGEVTESVEYFTEGPTISAGNLFGRQRVAQVYSEGVRLLDGVLSTGELLIQESTADTEPGNRSQILIEMADVADPYIMLRMNDGSVRLVTGDPESLTLAWCKLPLSDGPSDVVTACSLYVDRGPHPWLRGTVTNAHLPENNSSSGSHSFCIVARKSGKLEFYELPSLSCVFSMRSFTQGSAILVDEKVHHEYTVNGLEIIPESEEQDNDALESDMGLQIVVTEIRMVKWGNKFGRPFLFAILSDDSILSYHAFMFEREINDSSYAPLPSAITADDSDTVLPDEKSRLSSLRFARVPLEWVSGAEEGWEPTSSGQRIFSFENIGNIEGVFLTGPRPHWLMVFRERIRVHPQLCDGGIVAITPLHNVNCNHGFIYITSKGLLKICQLPSLLIYDSDWPLQKIPLRGTAYQITYYAEVNLYALIVSAPGSCLGSELHSESDNTLEDAQKLVTSEEFEVRILEPAKLGCAWETRQTIKMHTTEIALTVRIVSVKNIITAQTQTFLAIGTAFVQGEDVGAKGRIVLVSVGQDPSDPTIWVREVYSKELKGAISAVASLQGRLLVAIGPKIILHNWNGVELNGAAFFDAPLYVVSLNVVKNFVLFGDIQKSIYFLCWKEEGAQLVLLAKDFGELDCYATEFLIDGGTLSLLVSDSRKNIQIFSYAPKSVESWKGQKLLPRAEFHVGSHAQKFLRLQMLPVSSGARSNRFALFFGTLDGGIGYVAPLDELTFRRLQSLQRKLLYSVSHFGGLNPRSFRQFRSEGQTHRPGPEHIVDCELLCHYETLPLDEQVEVARQIGTTRAQILSNFRDLAISTSLM